MAELRFDGKVVLVTGAGRGAGRSHALSLASRGAKVVVADPGVAIDGSGFSAGPADEVASEIKAAGGEAVACYESVSEEQGAAAMVQAALDSFGRLDAVINNAGIAKPERFEVHTADEFRRMIDVHYLGTVYVTQAAWGHFMQNGGGRIVNTVSEGAMGTLPMMTAYGGAKGAVIGLTLALAAEGPKYGISVNGFAPRVASRMSSPTVLGHVHDLPPERFSPLGNVFPPELCSPAAIYLAHEACPLNGAMLVCGGGQVMRMGFKQNQGLTSANLTVEEIAENIASIADMAEAADVEVGMASRS
ncbi:NAD(P)-dependent dehydrogenase, short-chain alcohol dehydrogenase family [Novosphingobium sp. CF614]|uniref:SDR family NAD(P)-dependent oxidoreductase n=1 Tax=Novosphingobium sp. CF614 TaxID=1884364 RepID=UPI0008F42352|nr:SDR family NAD(P)-dependent oxidoreductase [Novosphingobium sp. CF614]SFF77274.1 NAD(P)-dependent dehydrogenase, short-chain alcohol dehydrogenase family [Novosphingobium sp. CF614]